ncbi:Nucleosome assembly protein 1,2 isoform 1 [Hibiscus syriacus]|uniref:Nucleosome assembly protein 1,2 isoform 1 n=1 Tax=Hibiscus syriacus TaxID=106335 RepID=A0A6A2YTE0_HIBSY|nr:Nucleosome assembly protein 1,2 isoform 1 [Hibiscus syriacus]
MQKYPFYRVMAANGRSPTDGKHLEVLGYYNPLPGQDGGKRMGLNFERVNSSIVFFSELAMVAMGLKGGQRDTRPIDPMTGSVLNLEKPDADNQEEGDGDEAVDGSNSE